MAGFLDLLPNGVYVFPDLRGCPIRCFLHFLTNTFRLFYSCCALGFYLLTSPGESAFEMSSGQFQVVPGF
jgi:hypothetical protein